ncbi:hypothetical protein A5893_14710 [Pedobacter psychrophilus]|uniref:Uncharacterized protein n=1 Tax=Pedobacter psychrophilus TaxID=1826909 RepID=A0A179DCL0_9SPHI|nr:hypothetical protein [Pedobacter psychrophilus]OAQ38654.1 hypothetical protein A5893_14710 [Pedobacter psychrophilus]
MKKFSITLLFISFIALNLKAQYVKDINGKPVMSKDFTNFTGTPYLYDNWTNGSITTEDGKIYTNRALKYDLFEDVLYFKSAKGESMTFLESLRSFELDNSELDNKEVYKNGFPPIDNLTTLSYYKLIYDGTIASLLMKNKKYISESKPYNSSTTEKKFVDIITYYIFRNGKMEKFKPSKKEILTLFSDKSEQINEFIKSSNIDYKNDEDLAKVFDFYYTSK